MRQIQDIKKLKKSTQKTAKFMHAMQLVSASKLIKTQENKDRSKEYKKNKRIVGHIPSGTCHTPLHTRLPVTTICIIVTSTDRGLCGNLNTSLFKKVLESIYSWQRDNIVVEIATIGKKARHFFEKLGFPIVAHAENLTDIPKLESILNIIQISTNKFKATAVQELHIFYNNLSIYDTISSW